MKKLIAIILILVMLVPAALADPAEPTDKYQTFGATKDIKNIFPGDYFSIDVFMSFDLNAYIQITTWDYHDVMTITKHAAIKSKENEKGVFYLLFADQSYYTFSYEDAAHTAIWLTIDGVSIRLEFSQWLVPVKDVKGK